MGTECVILLDCEVSVISTYAGQQVGTEVRARYI